jgi:curli biogenesis system outer membrane secretion channel CsgG
MRKTTTLVLVALLLLAGAAGAMEMRKRIAVSALEDKAGSSYNVGTGLADVLTTALVNTGKFQVYERDQLARVMEEQALGTSGLVTPQTAPEIGKLLGVQAIVYGSVTEFSTQEDSVGLGTMMGGIGFNRYTARVTLDLRIIDTTTGEIIFAHSATGEESEAGGALMVPGMVIGAGSDFNNTLEGKAARQAIDEIVEAITVKMRDIAWTGAVVKADGDKVYLNAGLESGIETGMEFKVYQKGEELIDPTTGISLGAEETLIGIIQVMDVKEKYAICRITSGGGFTAGDIVREKGY